MKGGKLHKCSFVSFSRAEEGGQAEKLLTELLAAEYIDTPVVYTTIWIKTQRKPVTSSSRIRTTSRRKKWFDSFLWMASNLLNGLVECDQVHVI